jgi:hypothetical protein
MDDSFKQDSREKDTAALNFDDEEKARLILAFPSANGQSPSRRVDASLQLACHVAAVRLSS